MTLLSIESSPLAASAETAAAENRPPEPGDTKNAALERCVKAWNRTHDLASINPKHESLDRPDEINEDEIFAREQGARAFRDALPVMKTSVISLPVSPMRCSWTFSPLTNVINCSKQPKSP
jgi:hypothetical protein